jgi:hypothetical protein
VVFDGVLVSKIKLDMMRLSGVLVSYVV